MKRLLVLGGGTGGAVAASRLGRWARPDELEVVLVDRTHYHEYRPSYLWVMTGKRERDDVRRPLALLGQRYGTRVVQATVTSIDPDRKTVDTDAGTFEYDYLIVALGSVLKEDPSLAGLEAPWELAHAEHARERLRSFQGGNVVVGPVEWPYRCPPAPFEVAFMLRYLADQRNIVDRTQVTVFHPRKQPMETFGPQMVEAFRRFLDDYSVGFEGSFSLQRHEPDKHALVSTDGRRLEYDFALIIPAHQPPEPVRTSPLAAPSGYMEVMLPSMLHPRYTDVWGVGDVVAPTIGLGNAAPELVTDNASEVAASSVSHSILAPKSRQSARPSGACEVTISVHARLGPERVLSAAILRPGRRGGCREGADAAVQPRVAPRVTADRASK